MSPELLELFAASHAGKITGSTISSWISEVREGHILYGAPWLATDSSNAIRRDVEKLTPPSPQRPPRSPLSREHLRTLCKGLDLSNTFDPAVLACASSSNSCASQTR